MHIQSTYCTYIVCVYIYYYYAYGYTYGSEAMENTNYPQIFFNSDKITLNSRKESMFLSSFQNIYIGTGLACNIVSEGETIIEASNVFLGKQAKTKKDDEIWAKVKELLENF